MHDPQLVMVDRVDPSGLVESEPLVALRRPDGGLTLVLDDGSELRFHRDDPVSLRWDEGRAA